MRNRIKRNRKYAYNFNITAELKIYDEVGYEGSPYHNYCDWRNHVFEKYGGGRYTETMLQNFLHYLKREKNFATDKKEIWNGCSVPMITVIIAIIYTFAFSVVNVINTYNNSINTLTTEEFLDYTGYNAEMIYNALYQNLCSGINFYSFSTILMILIVLFFLCFSPAVIRRNNLKNEFFADYIEIIQEIIETQQTSDEKTTLD